MEFQILNAGFFMSDWLFIAAGNHGHGIANENGLLAA